MSKLTIDRDSYYEERRKLVQPFKKYLRKEIAQGILLECGNFGNNMPIRGMLMPVFGVLSIQNRKIFHRLMFRLR